MSEAGVWESREWWGLWQIGEQVPRLHCFTDGKMQGVAVKKRAQTRTQSSTRLGTRAAWRQAGQGSVGVWRKGAAVAPDTHRFSA